MAYIAIDGLQREASVNRRAKAAALIALAALSFGSPPSRWR